MFVKKNKKNQKNYIPSFSIITMNLHFEKIIKFNKRQSRRFSEFSNLLHP